MNRYMSFPHTYGIIYIICQIKAVVENIKEYILSSDLYIQLFNSVFNSYVETVLNTVHSVNIVQLKKLVGCLKINIILISQVPW